jgi:hypothetical protein
MALGRPNNHAALTSPASLLTCRKNKNGRGVVTVLCRLLPAVFALFVASAAQAQNYPDRPIRLIAPFPAGGLADVLARAVGDEMSKDARSAGHRREPRRRRR